LCARFGVSVDKFPRIVEPSERVGRLTAEFAKDCGLPAGTPVIAGCGDTAASFLSCGATAPGICVDVAGTASVFAATTDSFAPDIHSGTLGYGRSVTPGLWHPYAYVNGGGMNLEWFRRELGGPAATFDAARRAR
jgi:xylulokinase